MLSDDLERESSTRRIRPDPTPSTRHRDPPATTGRRHPLLLLEPHRVELRLSWVLGVAVANLSFIPMALHRSVLGDLWWHAGAVGTTKVRDWIDRTLREKLGLPSGSAVRFLDLPIELRVVATDLTAGDLCVFGRATTPDVPVADAVTASMAYPLFFKPVHIKGSVFVDGGLTSNGPSWVLDDLRDAADARTPTFAFRLLDPLPMLPASPARARLWLGQAARRCLALAPAPPSRRPRLGPLAGRFIVSSLNSRSSLETRKIDDLHPRRAARRREHPRLRRRQREQGGNRPKRRERGLRSTCPGG